MSVRFRPLNAHDIPHLRGPLGIVLTEHTRGFVVEDRHGSVMAAVVFEHWTKTCVTVHWALFNPLALRHGLLEEIARYAFVEGDRIKIVSPVPSDNEKALRLNRKLGFTEVARVKDMFDHGVDAVIVELHRDDCKYLI